MSYLVDSIYTSDSNEWYTPAEFPKAAREVMGSIDLDPASCSLANTVIQATTYYTKEDDGLSNEWKGNIWLNPPYGRVGTSRQIGQTELWIEHLIEQYNKGNVKQAILLVNAYLYKQWFAPLWQYPICFPTGRLSFWNAQGQHGRSPHSSALVYFGSNTQRFVDVFEGVYKFGPVVQVLKPNRLSVPTLWDMESEAV